MPAKRTNSSKTKAKETVSRQRTLFDHFKSRRPSPSVESVESSEGGSIANVISVTQDSPADPSGSQDLETSSSQVSNLDPIDVEEHGASTITNDVSALPPSSPLSVVTDSPAATTSSSPEIVAVHLPEPPAKPLHPFFTRPTKAETSRLSPDIILLSDDVHFLPPSDEERPSQGSSSRSLLAPPTKKSLRRGHSYECPIVVDSSPVKASPPPSGSHSVMGLAHPAPSPRKFHPLFLPHASNLRAGSPLVVDRTAPRPAPFPDSESQHVKGLQQHHVARRFPLGYRIRTQEPISSHPTGLGIKLDDDIRNTSKETFLPIPCTAETKESYLLSIPNAHSRSHPSIGRIVSSLGENVDIPRLQGSSHMLWSDRWHPMRADEVLGNEQSALYLRDWLSALQLHITSVSSPAIPATASSSVAPTNRKSNVKSKKAIEARGTKRPRVIRSVDNKKNRKKRRIDSDDEDDWIVADEFSEPEAPAEDEEEEDLLTTRRIYRREPSVIEAPCSQPIYSFEDSLSNTILLTGPPGVGKTAAVYACAEELGWDVFEVYPGIGKRGGANLDNLIGEVGKSHLVGKTLRRHGDSASAGTDSKQANGFFGKRNGIPKESVSEKDEEDTGMPSNNFGFLSDSSDEPSGNGHVRQSIVLLEEVDILFRDDANFWPAVTNFIRECKRPVICTCNDPTLVPVEDLPLQATLHFIHADTEVATSYLQAICCAEGALVERQRLSSLYEMPYPIDDVDVPDAKVTGAASIFSQPDIRRAINKLQLWLSGSGSPGRTASKVQWQDSYQSVEDLLVSGVGLETAEAGSGRGLFHAELLSYVDSHLLRDPKDSAEAAWHNTTEATHDDEIGHPVLVGSSRALSEDDCFGMYDRDTAIAEDAIRRARGMVCRSTIVDQGMFRPRELFRARVEYHSQVVAVLGKVVPEAVLQRAGALHVEYGPWVRAMVAAEDAQEAALAAGRRGGRRTRNSLGYVRGVVGLGGAERERVRRLGL